MRAITDRNMIVQTRDIKQKVFAYALAGNLIDFFKDEMDDRKALNYSTIFNTYKNIRFGK